MLVICDGVDIVEVCERAGWDPATAIREVATATGLPYPQAESLTMAAFSAADMTADSGPEEHLAELPEEVRAKVVLGGSSDPSATRRKRAIIVGLMLRADTAGHLQEYPPAMIPAGLRVGASQAAR